MWGEFMQNNDDRRELLKIKQSRQEMLNEDNTKNEEPKKTAYEKPHGMAAVKNFLYYHKVTIIIAAAIIALAAFLVLQTVLREKGDIRVLVISTEATSELSARADAIGNALARYCPDFDKKHGVVVETVFIDLSAGQNQGQYYLVEQEKLDLEMQNPKSQIIITDEGFRAYASDENGFQSRFFTDLTSLYPEKQGYLDRAIRFNDTALAKDAGWNSCPDKTVIFVRSVTSEDKDEIEANRRALEVIENVINETKINS